ncbi:CadC family transcriptional regulator [Serratia nematodiphila]|nr:CadC family transcriptional regulator [Serratia nematodiphila]
MIFIINGRVKFNEYEGTLVDADDAEHVQPLVATTCRLLAIFVRNNEMLIKRRQLLEEVWEERGLKGTDGNLNNYISLLRRQLAQFGETELIITYPRKGFKFVAGKITRHSVDEMETEEEQRLEQEMVQLEQPAHETETRGRGGGRRLSAWLPRITRKSGAIVALFIGIVGLATAAHHFYDRGKIPTGTQYDDCQIYTLGLDAQNREAITNTVKSHINCQRKTKVYYYGKIISENDPLAQRMLVSCEDKSLKQPCDVVYLPSKQ